jgi:hypothetical protein
MLRGRQEVGFKTVKELDHQVLDASQKGFARPLLAFFK